MSSSQSMFKTLGAADIVPVVEGEFRQVGRKHGRPVWGVEVHCPYCRRLHGHSGGDGTPATANGRRQSHCTNGKRGQYFILAKPRPGTQTPLPVYSVTADSHETAATIEAVAGAFGVKPDTVCKLALMVFSVQAEGILRAEMARRKAL